MNAIVVVGFQPCEQTCEGVDWNELSMIGIAMCLCQMLFGWKKGFLDVGQCVIVNVQEVTRTLQGLAGNESLGLHSLALKRKYKSRFMSE